MEGGFRTRPYDFYFHLSIIPGDILGDMPFGDTPEHKKTPVFTFFNPGHFQPRDGTNGWVPFSVPGKFRSRDGTSRGQLVSFPRKRESIESFHSGSPFSRG